MYYLYFKHFYSSFKMKIHLNFELKLIDLLFLTIIWLRKAYILLSQANYIFMKIPELNIITILFKVIFSILRC